MSSTDSDGTRRGEGWDLESTSSTMFLRRTPLLRGSQTCIPLWSMANAWAFGQSTHGDDEEPPFSAVRSNIRTAAAVFLGYLRSEISSAVYPVE